MVLRFLLALASFAVVMPAASQQPAPAAPAAATPNTVAPHTCKKPEAHPGKLGSDAVRRNWAKDANGYLECLKKYAMDQQAIAKPLIDQAKPHIDSANAAVDEYNKAAAALKEEADRNN